MKQFFKSMMSVAIVAMAFAGCSKDATEVTTPATKGVKVQFKAEVIDETRATLTSDDDANFVAAWEDTDQIGIHAYAMDSEANDYTDNNIIGHRKNNTFETTFVNCPQSGEAWEYYAYYPYTSNYTDDNALIPFGSSRVQYDNAYNSQYDIMTSDKVDVQNAANAGEYENGETIVFNMHRQTAIAYFHFKTNKAELQNEKVVSVTLSVDDGKEIAADSVQLAYVTENPSIVKTTNAKNSIEITYDADNQPTANDFKAWFNLLPVSGVTSVTVEIETENYVAIISRNADANALNYEAGKQHLWTIRVLI